MGLMETGPGESGPAITAAEAMSAERVLGLAAEAMRRYDFSPRATLEPFTVAPGHVALRIDDPVVDERAVLRLHHPGRHHVSELRSELLWLDALLAGRVMEVPPPIAARSGERVITLDDPDGDGDRHATVHGWLEGEAVPHAAARPSDFARLGATAARLHAHTASWPRPAGFCRRSWSAARLLAPLDDPGTDPAAGADPESAALLARAEAAVRADLAAFPCTPDAYGLIHADLGLHNVLVGAGPAGEAVRVVDFDDCGPGWFAYDCASAFAGAEPVGDAPGLVAAWCEGYRSVRDLPPRNAAQIPAFLMLGRLTALGAAASSPAPEAGPARAAAADLACELAERYLRGEVV
ncbi:MAG: phosphotransferase [Patulibacter minatonensis]